MMKTPWGYNLTNTDSLPDFLTPNEFAMFTNNRFNSRDSRIVKNIPSATRSIQNYCGWHIYPNLECEMVYRLADIRDSLIGTDLIIQLPATFVSSVTSILLNAKKTDDEWTGDPTTDFYLDESGLIRIYDIGCFDRKTLIRIVYNAGVDNDQLDLIKELVAHRVVHAVTSSYGVMSETAGSVSVSYNATWAGNTRSTALPDDNKEILQPFRVKGVY